MERKRRVIVMTMAFTIMYALLVFIIIELTTKRNVQSALQTTENKTLCSLTNQFTCVVTCRDGVDYNLETTINQLRMSECQSNNIQLILFKMHFKQARLSADWLRNLKMNVLHLEIASNELMELDRAVFAGNPFKNLKTLVMNFSKQLLLSRNNFINSQLEVLRIEGRKATLNVENNCFDYIAPTLTTLQIANCLHSGMAIWNVFGPNTSMFYKLKVINLSYNVLPVLYNRTFEHVPNLEVLILHGSSIKQIQSLAFESLSVSMTTLSLSSNQLESLPKGLLDKFTRDGKIYLQGNRWKCNCELAWLWKFYQDHQNTYFDHGKLIFSCSEGNFTVMTNCLNSTTTSIVPTTPSNATKPTSSETIRISIPITPETASTTETTIPEMPTQTGENNETLSSDVNPTSTIDTTPTRSQDSFDGLDCQEASSSKTQLKFNRIYSHTSRLKNRTVALNFYSIQDTPYFEIKFSEILPFNEYLIWINTGNVNNSGCISEIDNVLELIHLNYSTTYIICLVNSLGIKLSPFDCTTLNTLQFYDERAWIKNRNKTTVITLLSIGTSLIVLVCSLLTYFCTKNNENNSKNNKKIQETSKNPLSFILSTFDKNEYASTLNSIKSDGYITPDTRSNISTAIECNNEVFETVRSRNNSRKNAESPPLPPNRPL